MEYNVLQIAKYEVFHYFSLVILLPFSFLTRYPLAKLLRNMLALRIGPNVVSDIQFRLCLLQKSWYFVELS